MNDYITIKEYAEAEFIEKKSRFIGYIEHVETEDAAISFINKIREQHRQATHNVYAYILRDGQIKRYSDDGEPQGTAGIPVLEVLAKEGLTDSCVVVTRYYGGIMLGAGGLVRAYSHGAKIAVDEAEILHMSPCTEISMEIDYAMYGKVSYIIPKYQVKQISSDFGAIVRLNILVKDSELSEFKKELTELTSATVHPYEEKHYYHSV